MVLRGIEWRNALLVTDGIAITMRLSIALIAVSDLIGRKIER